MKTLLAELKSSVLLTLVFAVLLCGAYPLAVWAGAQAFFPAKANGSLITDTAGTVCGSALLAQSFTSDKYFQPRPSAAGTGYDATSSGGTNLGPTSLKLSDSIKAAVAAYRAANGLAADAVSGARRQRPQPATRPHSGACHCAHRRPRPGNLRLPAGQCPAAQPRGGR